MQYLHVSCVLVGGCLRPCSVSSAMYEWNSGIRFSDVFCPGIHQNWSQIQLMDKNCMHMVGTFPFLIAKQLAKSSWNECLQSVKSLLWPPRKLISPRLASSHIWLANIFIIYIENRIFLTLLLFAFVCNLMAKMLSLKNASHMESQGSLLRPWKCSPYAFPKLPTTSNLMWTRPSLKTF